jgi:hypothetical protein
VKVKDEHLEVKEEEENPQAVGKRWLVNSKSHETRKVLCSAPSSSRKLPPLGTVEQESKCVIKSQKLLERTSMRLLRALMFPANCGGARSSLRCAAA